jgi:hypothetical protein
VTVPLVIPKTLPVEAFIEAIPTLPLLQIPEGDAVAFASMVLSPIQIDDAPVIVPGTGLVLTVTV